MPANLLVERMRFRRAPLAAAAVWFAIGIGCAHLQRTRFSFTPVPVLLAALLLLTAVAIFALRASLRIAWLPVGAVWLVLGFAAAQWQPSPPTPARLMLYADNLSRTVRGRVVRVHIPPPEAAALSLEQDHAPSWESSEEAPPVSAANISVDLALDSIEEVTPDTSSMVPISGGIRVALYGAEVDPHATLRSLRCGERLELPLRLKPPQRFRDPGAFQYGDYMLTQGVALQSSVLASRVQLLGPSSPTPRCLLVAAQSWASQRLIAFADSSPNLRLPRPLRLDRADA